MKIFLIGFMGSGKSVVGSELARLLGYSFIDLDRYIEEKLQTSVQSLFEQQGEEHFRRVEHEILLEVVDIKGDTVIATGGGTPCFYNGIEQMNGMGLTIYLRVSPQELLLRLSISEHQRPLLKGKNPQEMKQYIEELLENRTECYEQAKIAVDAECIDMDVFKRIVLAHMA